MRSIAGRTTSVLVIIMCFALGVALIVLNLSFAKVLKEQAQAEFTLWLQGQEQDVFELFKSEKLPLEWFDLRILSLAQLEEDGTLTPLRTHQDKVAYAPVASVLHTDRLGTFIFEVWSPRLGSLEQLRKNVVLGMSVLILLGLVIVSGLLVRELRPIRVLIDQASRLSQGSFEQHFDLSGSREVEALATVLEQIRLRFRQVVSGAITQAMIWEGQLALFPMSQLLIMLRFTAQSGVLVVMEGNNLGRICFKDGQIQGAFYKEQKGFRAFYAMFLLQKGNFKFNSKMKSFLDELSVVSWYSVLLYAARRVTSLQLIEQYIPDQRFVAKRIDLAAEMDLIQSDLTLAEWQLYDSIDGVTDVRDLARQLQWTPERVQRYLYRFAVVGLIESQLTQITEPPPDNVVSLWARAAWNHRSGGVQ